MIYRSFGKISLAVLVLAGLSTHLVAPFEADARIKKCSKGAPCTQGKSNSGQKPNVNPEKRPGKKTPRNKGSLSNSSGSSSSSTSNSGVTVTDTGVITGI